MPQEALSWSLVFVPDIGRNLPIISDLPQDRHMFACDFLWTAAL
jgi:hypothetical protein